MNFEESDFISIENFSLIWRWNQESHSILPKNILDSIKPTSKSCSKKIYSKGLDLYSKIDQNIPSIIDTADKNQKKVKFILRDLIQNHNEKVFIVWDSETAVITTWNSFINYWDDFCYASSDDVFIFPSSFSLILAYRHFEQFEFLNLSLDN